MYEVIVYQQSPWRRECLLTRLSHLKCIRLGSVRSSHLPFRIRLVTCVQVSLCRVNSNTHVIKSWSEIERDRDRKCNSFKLVVLSYSPAVQPPMQGHVAAWLEVGNLNSPVSRWLRAGDVFSIHDSTESNPLLTCLQIKGNFDGFADRIFVLSVDSWYQMMSIR